MVPKTLIRPAAPDDLAELARIEAGWPTTPGWSPAQFREELSRLIVIEQEGRLAGYAGISAVPPEAQLTTLAVDPRLARRGLGRRLLEAALEKACARGCSTMQLEVSERNGPAAALYRAAGFRVVGRRPKYYNDGSDALLMDKDL